MKVYEGTETHEHQSQRHTVPQSRCFKIQSWVLFIYHLTLIALLSPLLMDGVFSFIKLPHCFHIRKRSFLLSAAHKQVISQSQNLNSPLTSKAWKYSTHTLRKSLFEKLLMNSTLHSSACLIHKTKIAIIHAERWASSRGWLTV